jgi:hypothetical protein
LAHHFFLSTLWTPVQKNDKYDLHAMSKVIQPGMKITEYRFDYRDQKFSDHGGGGNFGLVKKGLSFVHHLSVFLGNLRLQKIRPPAKSRKK